MSIPQFAIRTVTGPGGSPDLPLPDHQGLDISPVFSQAGSITIKYPANGKNFSLLQEDTEIAVTLNGNDVGSLRCIIEQIEGDDENEASDGMVWTFTARTTLALFDRAVVYPQNWPSPGEPSQNYASVTPGFILLDQIARAQSRGALVGITTTFTAIQDSAGNDWTEVVEDISFDAGTKLSDVIQSLVDGGFIEVQMYKLELSIYKAPSLGTDKSILANPLRFQGGRDIKESPRKISSRDLATTLLIAGTDNTYVEVLSGGGVLSQWGRRESYWSSNITGSSSVLNFIGQEKLATLNVPLLEVTHGLFFEDNNSPQPIRDFGVGDWGLSNVGRGWETYRILQWVASVDQNGQVTGSVTLNDLVEERIARINNRLLKLENGTSSAGASNEEDDGKAPHAPEGVGITTDYYLDLNESRAFAVVSWSPVSTNADGTLATDMSYYIARWRYVGSSDWQPAQHVDVSTTSAYFAGIFTNTEIEAQVQAVDRYGHTSDWSVSATVTTARDLTAPNKPSAPGVTSNVGTLRVTWDGLDSTGQPQVADFAGVEVHVGTDGIFTPDATTLKDFLTSSSPSATTITGLTYGTDWFVRLVAVDTSNNKSDPSDQTTTSHTVLTQVVSTEIGTGQVGLNNTAFSDVGNLVDDGSFEIPSYRVSRQSLIGNNHFAFDSTTSSVGSWSLRSDSFSAGSVEYFTLQDTLPVKPGERIFGALDMRATSDATGTVNLDLAWFNGAGVQIDSSGNPAGGFYRLGGIDNTVKDGAWHSRVTGVSLVAPPTVASMRLIFYTTGRTAGTVWVDAVEVRRQVDTLLIGDAAITTAKIADLAVNDAKIANLSVGKLVTGTLGADIVVGARIKTADTGARVELNSTGLKVYNSSNSQTGAFNSADGSISLTGTLKSGTSGTRIEINPSGLPTIRLYSGAGTEFGFINGFTINGTDVGVGFNSSSFSGNLTQLNTRLVAFPSQVSLEVIEAATQDVSGGFFYADPTGIRTGQSKGGIEGASIQVTDGDIFATTEGGHGYFDLATTYAKIGINQSTNTENTLYFEPTFTRHYGRWENNVTASNQYQGLHMGRISVAAGFSGASVDFGPTMATALCSVATLNTGLFDDTSGTSTTAPYWGISVGGASSTGFTVGWDKGISCAFSWWSFRV